jgi:palmitoyltransferase
MAAASSSTSSSTSTSRRSFYICCGRRFSFKAENVLDAVLHICTVVVEKAVLVLGPILICFASAIIGGLSWTFFTIILPMMHHQYQDSPYQYWILGGHVTFVVFLLYQIIFNYFMCVTTPNKGVNYDTVVREMAAVTDFAYPETPQAVESFRRDFEEILLIRMKRRQMRSSKDRQEALAQKQTNQSTTSLDTPASEAGAVTKRKTSNTTKKPFPRPKLQPTNQQVRNWMLMAPDEWGYCQRSKQPKPPRSHYDHVTKTLVLCLDHYCPWMFNASEYYVVLYSILLCCIEKNPLCTHTTHLSHSFSLVQSVISIIVIFAISCGLWIPACSTEPV